MAKTVPIWYELTNSIVIWLVIAGLFAITIYTSYDYGTRPPVFSQFGEIQLIILAFIVLLLLFRYIKKIKIGTLLDIEFLDKAEEALNNATLALEAAEVRRIVDVPQIETAKAEINKVKGALSLIRTKYDNE